MTKPDGWEYANIREILGHLQGQRLMLVTQQDPDELKATGRYYVELTFEDGTTLHFPINDTDGFQMRHP